jgi:hypothetical protein
MHGCYYLWPLNKEAGVVIAAVHFGPNFPILENSFAHHAFYAGSSWGICDVGSLQTGRF